MTHDEAVAEAANVLRGRGFGEDYALALVLGSGLGSLAFGLEASRSLPYAAIPHMPAPGVSGHGGRVIAGRLAERHVLIFSGRAHVYETGDAAAMRVPIGLVRALGAPPLLLTNAAGSLRPDLGPGSLVAVCDHIALGMPNPLVGLSGDDRFVSMAGAYDPGLRAAFGDAARQADVPLGEGVYMWFSGPSFETAAEIRAGRALGADLVGMSIAPEVILARHAGLRVAAISVVTNYATGLAPEGASHAETTRGGGGGAGARPAARGLSGEPPVTFLPQETIRAKRDGRTLAEDEIAQFVAGLTSGSVTEGQAAAFAMAVFFRGLDEPECVALTRAMTGSGRTLAWDLPGPALDKHSTGGVGDAVSLALAPAVAACGGYVPMISGRGLGHTGGTLDKLDSIPGYRSQPDLATFRRVVRETGCAIIGQTADLAPADGRLYAIRDVTATVESIDLITASILSKKLAAGLDGLVMDVKVGSGAFMTSLADARTLASRIVAVANGAGLATSALLTDMDGPLASAAGNAVEVAYAVEYLTGRRREPRFHEVTVALGAEMLVLGRLASDRDDGLRRIEDAIASGAAAERFARMVTELGGPADLLERPDARLARAPVVRPVTAESGIVRSIDTRAVGLAVVALGGGRTRPQDAVDHAVGITGLSCIGDRTGTLGIVHARTDAQADAAAAMLRRAYTLGPDVVAAPHLIRDRIAA